MTVAMRLCFLRLVMVTAHTCKNRRERVSEGGGGKVATVTLTAPPPNSPVSAESALKPASPLERRMSKFTKSLGGSKAWISFDRIQMEKVPFAYGGSGHVFIGSLGVCAKGTSTRKVKCAVKCLHAQLMTPMVSGGTR